MDPLTHTLVGANLGATRLGAKTRLAAAAGIIGANLPDVDAILYFTGHQDFALGFRRGWTHGALALVVLPLIQTALLLAYAKARRIEVSPRWLLILSSVAILTHPALDWLNNYGMRWLMPFRGTWFYGDSVFIMDPWLWLILGCGWLAARKPTKAMVVVFVLVMLLLAWVVARRNTAYLAVVAIVAVILLASLLWQAKRELSTAALIVAACYIGARLAIHYATALEVREQLGSVQKLMVAPHPIDPRRWDVVAQTGDHYRYGRYAWGQGLALNDERIPVARPSREWEIAKRDESVRGFMTWVRFPWYEVRGDEIHVYDARYALRGRRGFGNAIVRIPAEKRHETPTSAGR
jgi:inner membrane protein